jgi:hypothetical protein
MAGRPPRTAEVKGVYIRISPALIDRVEHCHALLQRQHGPRFNQTAAYERIIEAGCAALEGTPEGQATPVPAQIPIADISQISISKISEIASEDYDIPGYGFPEDEETLAQPVDVPQASEMPSTAAEPVIEAPAPMLQTPYAPPGMQNCTAGLHHPPYPLSARACPLCRRNQRASEREAALAPAPAALAAPVPELSHNGNAVIQENAPRRPGRQSTLRQPIVDLLREHSEGLTAVQIKVYLGVEKNIGDTLAGMVRDQLLAKEGSGNAVRYLVAQGADTREHSPAKRQATSKAGVPRGR